MYCQCHSQDSRYQHARDRFAHAVGARNGLLNPPPLTPNGLAGAALEANGFVGGVAVCFATDGIVGIDEGDEIGAGARFATADSSTKLSSSSWSTCLAADARDDDDEDDDEDDAAGADAE